MELVIASANLHKIREFREMLKPFKYFDVLSLHHFPHYVPQPELSGSFKEIAQSKAMHAGQNLKKWVLADDSGLIVPAIGGAPGTLSKRYAGEEATDGENRKKLLSNMLGLKDLQRSAYYECWLALSSPSGEIVKLVSGACEGLIMEEERGRNGFGYDPLFVKHEYDKTFAEMEEQTKIRISHRRKALEKILHALETIRAQEIAAAPART